ncbi:pilus assembly protein PilM [Candidatus Saccharibacteria bacterium]|nr:pilus assembly protein PilM [Candidatus Saccharibacteria bacterium]MDO5474782.1 cell division FtsA domain-containing protein [Candidatus Saccharibacteria bacterium]
MSTILGLDIGTEFVKAVLAKPTKKGGLEILGVGKAKQADGNMIAGAVADIPAVVGVCEEALVEVEDQAGERANLAVVGIAGELIKGNTTTANYTRKNPNKPISESEMNDIIKKIQQKSGEVAKKTVALETGNDNVEVRLINSAIVSLAIDGYKVSNPIGFKGSELSILVYTAFAPLIHVAAIEKVCAELNLDLLTVAVEPFAVCRACLGDNPESNFSGVMMDIGGGTTDIAVVEDGGVEGTKMFSIGGKSFTRQIAESLGVDFETAEEYKLSYDSGELDDHIKAKVETAISRNLSVWLTGVEVALEEFNNVGSLPRDIMLCGGGASLSALQETLALSDWYESLPFARRPLINLIDVNDLPDINTEKLNAAGLSELNHSFITALGLLRVGTDTLAGTPPENKLKAKIAKLLQN